MIQLESAGLTVKRADGVSPRLRHGENKMSQLNRAVEVGGAGRGPFLLSPPFVLFRTQ